MKKYIASISILTTATAFLVVSASGRASSSAGPDRRYVAGQILVTLRASADAVTDADAGEFVAGVRAASFSRLTTGRQRAALLVDLDPGTSVEEAVREASSDPRVEYAEPNYLIYPQLIPNDTSFPQEWQLYNNGFGTPGADIDATRAWDLTTGSDDIVVAVVDTGVYLQHPDLAPNAWVNPREIPDNGIDDDNDGFIDDVNGWNFVNGKPGTFDDPSSDSHATIVTGLIGAVGNNGIGISGVAWHVKLMSVKFIGSQSGTTANAIKSINYVIDQKRRGTNVRVINASWGGPGDSSTLKQAIKDAGDAGIVFVCAAGNGGTDGVGDDLEEVQDFPSSWGTDVPSIIAVAALDSRDRLAGFSNYGHSVVHVGAPGVNVYSTYVFDGYNYGTGTSFSAPLVSGIAALLLSREPGLSPVDVKERIVRTADPVASLASKTLSSGRANAYNALTNTIPHAPTKPVVGAVSTTKKVLTVDGIGFVRGQAIIEVDGTALDVNVKFDNAFNLADGSGTRLTAKVGKAGIKSAFPEFQPVAITVFDPVTGERSEPFFYARP